MHNMKDIVRKIENSVYDFLKMKNIRSVLVAVSGGADSVALLCVCTRIASRYSLRVEAVNCNFHLRGTESDRDSSFTADLCRRLGIRLHQIEYDVDAYLNEHPGISTEMACRDLRYADFFRIMEEDGFDRVAVAHNSDDDIETMLLNMLRGSGIRGLKGMEKDNGKVLRPLIGVSRKEIEGYLQEFGREYIIDSSNLTSEYRRNFIRREVLPLLESRWPGARKSLATTVGIMKEEAAIIEDFYRRQLNNLMPDENTLLIYSKGVSTGTVLRFIEPFGGNAEIADEMMDSITKDFRERTWKLNDTHEAILERDRLMIVDSTHQPNAPEFIWTRMDMDQAAMAEVKRNRDHNIAYLPSEASSYTIREPEAGDRMTPLGMKGSRLVSDIISDAKLDRESKSKIRVLVRVCDGKIIWVTGLKRSRHDLIREDTDHCYKVEYRPDELTGK